MNNPITQELARRAGAEPSQVTQATAIEQARAVAEVQAAVVVAQQRPRDIGRAEAEMRDACSRLAVAERAFYSVPNRGHGLSVHLARELARIWGNLTYGVRELRRDDAEGMSEMEVFAWDWQANVRPSRTVQVPHARMKGRSRQKLDDLKRFTCVDYPHGSRTSILALANEPQMIGTTIKTMRSLRVSLCQLNSAVDV